MAVPALSCFIHDRAHGPDGLVCIALAIIGRDHSSPVGMARPNIGDAKSDVVDRCSLADHKPAYLNADPVPLSRANLWGKALALRGIWRGNYATQASRRPHLWLRAPSRKSRFPRGALDAGTCVLGGACRGAASNTSEARLTHLGVSSE